jgi:hypothetical protein
MLDERHEREDVLLGTDRKHALALARAMPNSRCLPPRDEAYPMSASTLSFANFQWLLPIQML